MRSNFKHAITFSSVILLGILATSWSACAEGDIRESNDLINISIDGKPILEYCQRCNPNKVYVSKIYSPSGLQILLDSPHDHVHHHGLMYAIDSGEHVWWKDGEKNGKQKPAAKTETEKRKDAVIIRQPINWNSSGGKTVLQESRTIIAHIEEDIPATLLTWKMRLSTAGSNPVTLDTKKHYAGLGIRFVRKMDKIGSFIFPDGSNSTAVRGTEKVTPDKWCAYVTSVDNKPVTVAMFSAPSNVRHPTYWFTMTEPFAYISATLNLYRKPYTLKSSSPLDLTYGIAVFDGKQNDSQIEKVYQSWLTLMPAPKKDRVAVKTKPNIILVFIDDMGWADFSSFGNKDAKTPNIDRMAMEGIAFEQFYVNSPICSPSRVAISTGTYPQRWKITSYLAHRASNKKRGIANWLDPKAPMLARSLKQSGYATGHFGKWHMGGQRDVTEAPAITEYGFDESLTNFEGMGPKILPLTINKEGKTARIWEDAERLGKPVTWMQRSEITTGFIDAAIPFMNRAKKDGKPFYVNLWPDDVHSPYWPSYQRIKQTSNKRELYLAVLEEMDKQFSKLFDFIRNDENLRDNTIILICSDNGPEKGAGLAGPFKGFKTHLYEGGIRSSLIVWAPGLIKRDAAGSINKDSVFSAIDLTPSLLELSGSKAPSNTSYDGENVLDTLLGKSQASRQAPIFFGRPPDRKSYYGFKDLPDLAIRDGKRKLLCNYDGTNPQLYNMITDPGETRNLAEKQPELTEALTEKVMEWYRSMPSS